MLQGGDASRLLALANGGFPEGSRPNGYSKDSVDPSKNEKEEGELSPNGDFEEDNFVAYREGGSQGMPGTTHGDENMQYPNGEGEENCCQDAAGENDADADDEDSENVSEAGEDVSGSESAADECSREENEEEEDGDGDGEHDDLDGKGESEGEAEGGSEAHFVGGDGTSMPTSERFVLNSKPLTKHVPLVLGDNGRMNSRIFYGNDSFYVLFRLHQVSLILILTLFV